MSMNESLITAAGERRGDDEGTGLGVATRTRTRTKTPSQFVAEPPWNEYSVTAVTSKLRVAPAAIGPPARRVSKILQGVTGT